MIFSLHLFPSPRMLHMPDLFSVCIFLTPSILHYQSSQIDKSRDKSSILSTCPNHVSLLLLIFSITVSSIPSSSFVFSFLILSLLRKKERKKDNLMRHTYT